MKIDDPLMRAVLGEDEALRAATLLRVRRLARRRRRIRAAVRIAAVCAAVACAAFFLVPRPSLSPAKAVSATDAPHREVRTQSGLFTLVERQTAGPRFVTTTRAGVDVFETRSRLVRIAFLDDDQLFGVFPGRRVAIVDPGTASARLIVY